ncbi:hypothetical protein OG455_10965 [Kitasatospora sp. NBC_01287]|uniref:hypothetical protein n=1 Tax=Kitasatospora sp. NBC_01287 TaxID=2903573 RepID=UPI002257E88F|nr:hypothetical protein [Kitasatospora sp. NBC_01287]MCX4746034.1 hypothetical protein [Kitasatospora sp. NBC_01287]
MSPTCACAPADDEEEEEDEEDEGPGGEPGAAGAEAEAWAEETGVVVTVPEEQPAAATPNAAAHSEAVITAWQRRTAIAS